MTSYIKKCPECGGINLMLNKGKGEIICRDCGLVIEEKMIDFSQEWREFDHEQADRMRRTGAPISFSVDAEEPIIIEQDHKIKIVKIGDFVDHLMADKQEKVELMEHHLEVLPLNEEIRAVSFDSDYDIGFRRISEVSRHPAEEVYEIVTETGRKVNVTGNHSVFTVNNNKIVSVKVDNLKEGVFLVAPHSLPVSNSPSNPELSNDLMHSQFGINSNYQEAFIEGHIINKTSQYVNGSLSTRANVTNPDSLVKLGFLDTKLPINKGKQAIENFIPAPLAYKKEWKSRNRIKISKDLAIKIAEKHFDRDLMKLATADFTYLRITKIKKTTSTNGYAYDLTVPGAQNFVGGRGGLFLHNTKFDKGLGTDIGQKGDIYKLDSKDRNKFFRLRKWQYRVSTAIERNLKLALAELRRVASYLKLPKSVEEEAARVYTMAVQRGLVRGRSMESVVAGALYAACRRHEVPRTLDELAEASGIDKKEIGRTYRFVTRELGIRILPSNPVDYLPRFASALKLTPDTQSKAVEILEKAQQSELTSGRGPTGIAAASLYVAALINNEKKTQREVADVAGVTEVTIRNRYKELLKKLNLKDQIKKKE